MREYVAQRNGGYFVQGTRVSLDSVVYAFLRGESSDGIVESFPALSLEQVYGALAFYLAHRESIDCYLQEGKAEFARLRDEARRGWRKIPQRIARDSDEGDVLRHKNESHPDR